MKPFPRMVFIGNLIYIKLLLQALISAGANIESRNSFGNTPLHAAIIGCSYECTRELLNYDDVLDINATNKVKFPWINIEARNFILNYIMYVNFYYCKKGSSASLFNA